MKQQPSSITKEHVQNHFLTPAGILRNKAGLNSGRKLRCMSVIANMNRDHLSTYLFLVDNYGRDIIFKYCRFMVFLEAFFTECMQERGLPHAAIYPKFEKATNLLIWVENFIRIIIIMQKYHIMYKECKRKLFLCIVKI